MIEVFKLRSQTYSYLTDGHDESKKRKTHKKCVIKERLKFQDYKHCLKATQLGNKINKLEKSKWMIIVIKKITKNSKKKYTNIKTKANISTRSH